MFECNPPMLIENTFIAWENYLDFLYKSFQHDFILNKVSYNNSRVYANNAKGLDGREKGFWHLITKEAENNNRYPDPSRCERLSWIKYIIEECSIHCTDVKLWQKFCSKSNRPRIYIWCDKFNYVVVLEEHKKHYMLITAYNVTYPYKKRAFQKEYESWLKTKTPII